MDGTFRVVAVALSIIAIQGCGDDGTSASSAPPPTTEAPTPTPDDDGVAEAPSEPQPDEPAPEPARPQNAMDTLASWIGSPVQNIPTSACSGMDPDFRQLVAAGRIEAHGNFVRVPLPELDRVQTESWYCSSFEALERTPFTDAGAMVQGGNVVVVTSEMTFSVMPTANTAWNDANRLLSESCEEREEKNDRYIEYRGCSEGGRFASVMRTGTESEPGVWLWIARDEEIHDSLRDAMAAGP